MNEAVHRGVQMKYNGGASDTRLQTAGVSFVRAEKERTILAAESSAYRNDLSDGGIGYWMMFSF